ncbi:tetrapyrrole methylase family protein/MazG family protein [Caldalkalibacillus uzonensis]|uniref:Tetrapyrrole methylase family protein/MazG family protein n=1 Tax=Caldalkalibacillus uzonensis TaxID=353224 RepID=A0ABU0CW47_9BACI|nr:MazG family protein [Caldalkalibacillus uzonensis]MDQ0340645.1 tetrapyrrole methylase family protein/MazG family protein [Caldalkalibacillus uzonensis]
MATIHILGLGAGTKAQLPLGVYETLKQAQPLFVRTKDHPVMAELEREGLTYRSFDEVYERHPHFQVVYEEIVNCLLEEAKRQGTIYYAVPGHPLVAEQTVHMLLNQGSEKGVTVHIGGGQSFLDPLFARLQIDPNDGCVLLDGTCLTLSQLNPRLHHIITQVYDRFVASEVKLTLMELYPDDYSITVATAVGVIGQEQLLEIPLYELDRVLDINNMTAVYVPPATDEQVLNRLYDQARDIFRTLRGPDGCPWDKKQTHESLKKYVLEEAQEVCEAIDAGDVDQLKEELGDLLLQVFLHAQIAEEEGLFNMEDVLQSLNEKMIRRHPHVFGDLRLQDAEDVKQQWEKIKAEEYRQKQNRQKR